MSDWLALRALREAHRDGLLRLAAIDGAADELKAGGASAARTVFPESLRFFEGPLDRHFRHEEHALFPVLARFIGRSGPIGAMVSEHESIWRSIDQFAAIVERRGFETATLGAAGGEAARLAKHIVFLLRGHIEREDDMLFPLAARTLDEGAKDEVTQAIKLVV